MILRGGENISPAEVEQALLSHPAVKDAVCFGVADDKYGELVSAAVTLSAQAGAAGPVRDFPERPGAVKGPATNHALREVTRTASGQIQLPPGAEHVAIARGVAAC